MEGVASLVEGVVRGREVLDAEKLLVSEGEPLEEVAWMGVEASFLHLCLVLPIREVDLESAYLVPLGRLSLPH